MAQGIHGALGGRVELLVEAVGAGLQAAQGLVQRLLKGAANAARSDLIGKQPQDGFAIELDLPLSWCVNTGD